MLFIHTNLNVKVLVIPMEFLNRQIIKHKGVAL